MQNNLLLINRHAPYGNSLAKDALDAALVCAAYEQKISILFRDDGIFQLLKNQQADKIQQKSFSALLSALEFYDIEDLYVHQESMNIRNLAVEDFVMPEIKLISNSQLSALFATQKHILSF